MVAGSHMARSGTVEKAKKPTVPETVCQGSGQHRKEREERGGKMLSSMEDCVGARASGSGK